LASSFTDTVARPDLLVPAGDDHLLAADEPDHLRVGRHVRLAQRATMSEGRAMSRGTSNSTICTAPSAKTSVCRAAGIPM
jgi:hypothetical protein